MRISRPKYIIFSFLILFASFFVQFLPILLTRDLFFPTGYGYAFIPSYFIANTGHLYGGQWDSYLSQKELNMGWAPIGQNSDLLEAMLLGMLRIVTGSSLIQSFYLSHMPAGSLLYPLLMVGFYKQRAGVHFSYSNALIILAFSSFGSLFLVQTIFFRIYGMSYFFYLMILSSIGISWSSSNRSDQIIFIIFAVALTASYHTLSSYVLVILSLIFVVQIVLKHTIAKKSYDLKINRIILGIFITLFLGAYMFSVIIYPFAEAITSYLLNAFSSATSLAGLSGFNITNSVFSKLDIVSEGAAGIIFLSGFFLGLKSMVRANFDKDFRYLFYICSSLIVFAVLEVIGLGLITALARIFQAIYPVVPLVFAILLLKISKSSRKILVAIALICILVVSSTSIIYYRVEFGLSTNTVPATTFAEINYVAILTPQTAPIFTDFATAGSLLYFGHVDVFGLSDFDVTPLNFETYASILYNNGTRDSITKVVHEISGSSSVIFLFQKNEQNGIPVESTVFVPPNKSILTSYEKSFDQVYSNGQGIIWIV